MLLTLTRFSRYRVEEERMRTIKFCEELKREGDIPLFFISEELKDKNKYRLFLKVIKG